jgi:hypothetical protein
MILLSARRWGYYGVAMMLHLYCTRLQNRVQDIPCRLFGETARILHTVHDRLEPEFTVESESRQIICFDLEEDRLSLPPPGFGDSMEQQGRPVPAMLMTLEDLDIFDLGKFMIDQQVTVATGSPSRVQMICSKAMAGSQ